MFSNWRRPAVVTIAVLLAGIPTAYAVFARELTDDVWWIRWLVALVWLGLALIAARLAAWREERIDRFVDEWSVTEEHRSLRAAPAAFNALLEPGRYDDIPSAYEFTVYYYDEATDLLVPFWPDNPEHETVKSFRPGCGATGKAWDHETTFLATEDAVSNDEHELTPEQQAFFKDYRAVVAEPVRDGDGDVIAVLTAISRENDGFFEASNGREQLRDLALVVGAILDAQVVDTPPE